MKIFQLSLIFLFLKDAGLFQVKLLNCLLK